MCEESYRLEWCAQYLDLLHSFDFVVGASAGSLNGADFISEQAMYGTSFYYDHIYNARFIKNLPAALLSLA